MRYLLVVICLLLTLNSNGQEKRLAWVIGNSNYDKGFLKNPVNDALLVAKTLKELNFTVLLDTNIATEKDFNDAVRKFGEQRSNFNIGFIYYAGHGIQIKDVNYLLPTKEDYLDEYDIEDKALSVQKIMRYIEDRSSEVNVLILDACRDNPFEKTWKATGRSLEAGRGLAKANPPTGSLIAYSTDAGNIAADGTGKNSIYCLSLVKNMQKENLALDQVFRNVRAEVLKLSEGKQRPVEASQLTGEAFYLKKGTYMEEFHVVDSLIQEENYTVALQVISNVLAIEPSNKKALCNKGLIFTNLKKDKYDASDFFLVIKLYPNDPEPLVYLARYYNFLNLYEQAFNEFEKAINKDSLYSDIYFYRSRTYVATKQFERALADHNRAIEIMPKSGKYFYTRGWFYSDYKNDHQTALDDFNKAIELDSNNKAFLFGRGMLYSNYLNNNIKAIEDFNKILVIDSINIKALNAIGVIYENQNELDKAIKNYGRGIALEKNNPEAAAYCYMNRGDIFSKKGMFNEALSDYINGIKLFPTNAEFYIGRGMFYSYYFHDYQNALIDFTRAIEIDSNNTRGLYQRGYLYATYLANEEKALLDFNKMLQIDSINIDAINSIGRIYQNKNEIEKAIHNYERGIVLEKNNPKAASYCYRNRAKIYEAQNLLDKAISDYTKAIELNNKNADRFFERGVFYRDFLMDYKNTLGDFNAAIELDPNNTEYLFQRGQLYFSNIENIKSALDDFNKVLELDSTYIDAINAIGLIYQHENETEKAIKTYEKGIALEKTNPISAANCYSNRAQINVEKNDYDKALNDYNKAIELDPINAIRYIDRGLFFTNSIKDYQNALLDFSRAIEIEPNNTKYLYQRGYLYTVFLGNSQKALIDFNKMLELDSLNIDAINSIGLLYQEENELQKAIKNYERGIALEKNNPESAMYCYRNRATVYEKLKLFDNALKDYNKSIELDPQNPNRYIDRAVFYTSYKKDYQNALKDLTKAIEIDPQNTLWLYHRGYLYSNYLANDEKALLDFNKILQLDSINIDAINSIGKIYQNKNELEKAIKNYERGITLEKINPQAAAYCYTNRAVIYVMQNLLDSALSDYTKAINLDPANPYRYFNRGQYYEYYKQDFQKALIDYSYAIQLDSTNTEFLYKRASLFSDKLSNHFAAIEDCKKYLEFEANDAIISNWIGVYYDRLGDKENARKYYIETIHKNNFSQSDSLIQYTNGIAWSYSNLAEEFQENNNLDSATLYYSFAIKYDPKEPERYYRRGVHYNNYLKNIIFANEDYTKAIELDKKNPIWYFYKSQFFFSNSNEKEALSTINKAIELSDNKSFYVSVRGNYYRAFKKYDLAQKDLNEAMNLDSNLAFTYHYQILLLKENSQIQEAIKFGEQTISKFKNDTVANYLLGEIYLEQKDYLKSLKYFNNALSIMELDSTYQTEDQEIKTVYLSNTYQKVGEVYQLLGDKELPKEYYTKALEALKDEIRPDKVLKERELQGLIKL